MVVGSFNVDHAWQCASLPQSGETLAGRYRSGPGGKGFNQAVASRRAGAETTFVCALGDDAGGRLARELAKDDGIALHARSSGHPTGTAGIFVDAQGRNSIVIGPGANATLAADDIEAAAAPIAAAQVLLAQLETPSGTVRAALCAAREAGATTILNPAPANAEVDATLLALADVLTPNETEFAALCARHVPGETVDAQALPAMADATLHAMCRRLLPRGTVVVTLGAAGCFVSHPDAATRGDAQACYRVPAETVAVVDTTGAGDAFNGALAASLAAATATAANAPAFETPAFEPQAFEPQAFERHARFASRYAALSTEREGAASAMPALADIHARFAG